MSQWRLSRGGYLAAWLVLVGLQFLWNFVDLGLDSYGIAAWVVFFQVLKIVPTVGRLADLGRSPDDALFATLIPVANLYAFFAILIGATPKEARRQKLVARWEGQPSWATAAVPALGLMAKTAGPGLLAVLLLGLPITYIQDALEAWVTVAWAGWTPEQMSQYLSVVGGLTAFLGLYTGLQLAKRQTASAASWLPAVAFLPLLLVSAALAFTLNPAYATLTPLRVGLMSMALGSFWYSTVGAFAVLLWVIAADAANRGEPLALGDLLGKVREKLIVVMPSHAGRTQLVLVGAQVIVPGLFYWVYAAFVVMVGAFEEPPPHPLTTRSGKLTWGMMSRLVKLAGVYAILVFGSLCLVIPMDGIEVFQSAFMGDLTPVPMSTQVFVELAGDLSLWWVSVVLCLFYRSRVAQLEAARARKASAGEPPAA